LAGALPVQRPFSGDDSDTEFIGEGIFGTLPR
jgi:hypothetical protein